MLNFIIVFAVAASVTAVATPFAGRFAFRVGAVAVPTARKVHDRPTPQLGGVAMLAGYIAALGVAFLIPDFRELFSRSSELMGLTIGVFVIVLIGFVDDTRGLPPTVKLAGQIVAALGPLLFGIQIVYAWVPGLDVIVLAPDLGFPLTIIAIVAMVNAVNLIDGLDGLAAGIVGIAALAFFTFTFTAGDRGLSEALPSGAPLIAATLAGMCAGFLLHNFHPASIFMGDTGSMMLGLLLASAGVSYVGRTTAPSYADFAGSIPLVIPALILAVPFMDTLFAVARRIARGQSVSEADKGHLHHLLIAFGYSHRRAVLTLYYWSALLGFAAIGLAVLPANVALGILGGAVVVGAGITAQGVRAGRQARRVGVPAEDELARRRSG